MNKVIINSQKFLPISKGHPFIFPKAIQSKTEHLSTGELVEIYTPQNQLFGIGVFNPHSLYRVRVLSQIKIDGAFIDLAELIRQRFKHAKILRKAIGLPSNRTTGYRFFNSEADGLSGLTIDIYANHAVILSSAYWVEANRTLLLSLLTTELPDVTFIWRSQIKHLTKDGWTEPAQVDNEATCVSIKELDITYQIDFANAQKSGFYFDQRDNRALVRELAQGKRVLDICCYSGGFSLNAALGGAQTI